MLKMQPEMSESMKIVLFPTNLRKGALQTFRNTMASNKRTLEDVLTIFRRKYVRPQTQATTKHKWHQLNLVLRRNHSQISLRNKMKVPSEFWASCTTNDRQFATRQITSTSQAVNWLRWFSEMHIRSISCSLRKRTRIDWVGNRWRITFLLDENHNNNIERRKSTTKCRTVTKTFVDIAKNKDMSSKNAGNTFAKNRNDKQNTKIYPPCPHCQKTNHTADMCWNGQNRPKRHKIERITHSTDDIYEPGTSIQITATSILKNLLN